MVWRLGLAGFTLKTGHFIKKKQGQPPKTKTRRTVLAQITGINMPKTPPPKKITGCSTILMKLSLEKN